MERAANETPAFSDPTFTSGIRNSMKTILQDGRRNGERGILYFPCAVLSSRLCPSEGKFVDGMDIDGIEEETPMDEGTPEPEDHKPETRAVRFVSSACDEPEPEMKDDQPDEERPESSMSKLEVDT